MHFNLSDMHALSVGPPNFKNYSPRLFMLIFPRDVRVAKWLTWCATKTAKVARGRGFESHCRLGVILKLAWGPNNLSPGTWRFGSANKELLSNWLGGRVIPPPRSPARFFWFLFLLVLIFLIIFFFLFPARNSLLVLLFSIFGIFATFHQR